MMEKKLVQSLQGNFQADSSTISTLETDFSNGIALNMQNAVNVSISLRICAHVRVALTGLSAPRHKKDATPRRTHITSL